MSHTTVPEPSPQLHLTISAPDDVARSPRTPARKPQVVHDNVERCVTPHTPPSATSPSCWSPPSPAAHGTPITPPLTPEIRAGQSPPALPDDDDALAACPSFDVEASSRVRLQQSSGGSASGPHATPTRNLQRKAVAIRLDRNIGSGQWSSVYTGALRAGAGHAGHAHLHHPPPPSSAGGVVAVKLPADRVSVKTLHREAALMAAISSTDRSHDFVVDFVGYDWRHACIVMEYLPLGLEELVSGDGGGGGGCGGLQADILRPLALALVRGLAFLHAAARVVHGDVKPANIRVRRLLGSADGGGGAPAYQPVYCDFSAAHPDRADAAMPEGAGTYEYTAPELFRAAGRSTAASDVYALGMTLLYAAMGRGVYAECPNVFVLRAMAMQGRPLDAVADIGAMRKVEATGMRGWVEGAVRASPERRPSAVEWLEGLERSEITDA